MRDQNGAWYPIGTVARRTGLTTHLIRAWERRYGAAEPIRGDAGERLYSEADVARLRLLRRLSEAGHPIRRIASLGTEELVSLLGLTEEQGSVATARPIRAFLESAERSARELDAGGLHATLSRAAVVFSLTDFIDHLVVPLLRRVGEMWSEGGICPAHEHVVSVQVARVVGWMAAAVAVPASAPRAVATTLPGQSHEFGAMLSALLAGEAGWRVTYLGPDLPVDDIATAAQQSEAELVLLSAVLPDGVSTVPESLRSLRAALGGEAQILIGGAAADAVRVDVEKAGARWVPDLATLRSVLREVHPERELK